MVSDLPWLGARTAQSDHVRDSEYMRNAMPQGKAVPRDLAGAWGTANPWRTLRAAERATGIPMQIMTLRNALG